MSRIVVLGSLNTDLVAQVPHLPRPGETVLGDRLRTFPGGKGANQAVAAARLGGLVSMVGRVGNDTFGTALLEQLASDGVDAAGVARDPQAPTGAALILVETGGQNQIAVVPGANLAVADGDVSRALELLADDSLLVLQQEIAFQAVEEAIRRSRARVLLNAAPPRPLGPDLLRRVDVLVVNETEAAALLFDRPVTGPALAADAARVAHERGVALAVVTLGAAGAVFCDEDGPQLVDPFPVAAVDVTAAGDAFVGALAVALSAGVPARQAVRLANAAGAAAATRAGAQTSLPFPQDLKRLFGIDWPVAVPAPAQRP